MLNPKIFSLPEEELPVKDVPQGYAIVSDQVAKEGMPIRFLYREEPDAAFSPDSGWRMFPALKTMTTPTMPPTSTSTACNAWLTTSLRSPNCCTAPPARYLSKIYTSRTLWR